LSNHARVLARLNRALLEAFSRRTTDALRAALPLRLALPHLEPLLARNVAKEVRKDALVIARADRVPATGAPDREAVRELLQAARKIDGEFLAGLSRAPIRVASSSCSRRRAAFCRAGRRSADCEPRCRRASRARNSSG
jgi:hypothetical protein